LTFSSDVSTSSNLNTFIKALLTKRLNKRICSVSKLKALPFFAEYSWDDLIDFKITPPFIPKSEDEFAENFANFNTPFEQVNSVSFLLYIFNSLNL